MNEGSRRPGDLEAGFFGDFLLKESQNKHLKKVTTIKDISSSIAHNNPI